MVTAKVGTGGKRTVAARTLGVLLLLQLLVLLGLRIAAGEGRITPDSTTGMPRSGTSETAKFGRAPNVNEGLRRCCEFDAASDSSSDPDPVLAPVPVLPVSGGTIPAAMRSCMVSSLLGRTTTTSRVRRKLLSGGSSPSKTHARSRT